MFQKVWQPVNHQSDDVVTAPIHMAFHASTCFLMVGMVSMAFMVSVVLIASMASFASFFSSMCSNIRLPCLLRLPGLLQLLPFLLFPSTAFGLCD